jgi:hypothetical protein
MARWNDTTTPLNFTSIDSYVRNARRHVWRNMDIVDLQPDATPDAQFIVRGLPNGEASYLVITSQAAGAGAVPWEKLARLRIKLLNPEKYEGEWVGENLEKIDKFTLEAVLTGNPSVIGPILLKEGQDLAVSIAAQYDSGAVRKHMANLDNDALNIVRVMQTGRKGVDMALKDAEFFGSDGIAVGGNTYVLTISAASKAARVAPRG